MGGPAVSLASMGQCGRKYLLWSVKIFILTIDNICQPRSWSSLVKALASCTIGGKLFTKPMLNRETRNNRMALDGIWRHNHAQVKVKASGQL